MKKTAKLIAIALAAILAALSVFAFGCKETGETKTETKYKIVTTIFPEYDWVRNVLGSEAENAEIVMLLDNGVDLHSYQPTVQDILDISTCDLFLYVGGESDKWVADALREAVNKDMIVVNLMEKLGSAVKVEERVEGMQEDHDHGGEDEDHDEHDEDHDEHDEDHDGEEEYDEHIWLSLRNAQVIMRAIKEAVCSIDPENAAAYEKNAETYCAELAALDEAYQNAIGDAKHQTLVFGDRFPFRYLTDDYGLTYYAAFQGCSAETEASFETVLFLAGKVDELALPAVMAIEGSDGRIASTVISNTAAKNQKVLKLDSMQSTTAKNVKEGTTYLSVMEKNLEVIREALN